MNRDAEGLTQKPKFSCFTINIKQYRTFFCFVFVFGLTTTSNSTVGCDLCPTVQQPTWNSTVFFVPLSHIRHGTVLWAVSFVPLSHNRHQTVPCPTSHTIARCCQSADICENRCHLTTAGRAVQCSSTSYRAQIPFPPRYARAVLLSPNL